MLRYTTLLYCCTLCFYTTILQKKILLYYCTAIYYPRVQPGNAAADGAALEECVALIAQAQYSSLVV